MGLDPDAMAKDRTRPTDDFVDDEVSKDMKEKTITSLLHQLENNEPEG